MHVLKYAVRVKCCIPKQSVLNSPVLKLSIVIENGPKNTIGFTYARSKAVQSKITWLFVKRYFAKQSGPTQLALTLFRSKQT